MSEPLTNDQGCPKCLNQQGFVFGTCIECGWNSLDHSYHHIVVWDPKAVLPADVAAFLIARHDEAILERRRHR